MRERLLRRLVSGLLQILGATLVAFVLLTAFSPDPAYDRLGKSATPEQIRDLRHSLGLDRPFLVRYATWLGGLATLDPGTSLATGEPVRELVGRTLPVTAAVVLPGFLLGHLLALGGALACARRRGGRVDRALDAFAGIGASLSFVIVLIAIQALLCSPAGLDLLPTRGWSAGDTLRDAAAPTIAMTFITFVYALRYDRALILAELARPHVVTARAFGASPWIALTRHALRGAAVPIVSRALYGLPPLLLSGSLLLETQFGIPGLGQAASDAITGNDGPVLLAITALAAAGFVVVLNAADLLGRRLDPRMDLP